MSDTATDEETEDQGIDASDIDLDFTPVRREDVAAAEVDGETVLLNTSTGWTHLLNPTATVVWECLDGSGTLREIAADLAEAFGAGIEVVEADVQELAVELGKKGLLEGVRVEVRHVDHSAPQGLPLGSPFPSFELPGLDGTVIRFDDYRGKKLLLINWSPACGYCDRIAPDLEELREPLENAGVRTLLVAIGTAEANEEKLKKLELSLPLALQAGSDVEPFAGQGTPVAYLLDEEGSVASTFAVGAVEVPHLAREAAGVPHEH